MTPIRAVAIAEVDGPEAALAVVDTLDLDGYHACHATRADLLRRTGDTAAAVTDPVASGPGRVRARRLPDAGGGDRIRVLWQVSPVGDAGHRP